MRKLIYLLVLFVFSTIVNASEMITISGKIINTADGKLKIHGESFDKEIILKPDGSFSESLTIAYSGSYSLSTSQNRVTLYLAKNTNLNIDADDHDFFKTIKYTGKGGVENQYIAQKSTIVNSIPNEEFYRLKESDFLKKAAEINAALQSNYNKTAFEDAGFKANEAKSLSYLGQVYLLNYPNYHAHYAKSGDFNPSTDFPKADNVDLDNESDYLFSNAYKQLVILEFNALMQANESGENSADFLISEIRKHKSQSIKNELARILSGEIGNTNPESEKIYRALLEISTDEKFKNELNERYSIKMKSAGKIAPQFNYENQKGGKTSLASFKGKYVYIDVWATWCGPCRQEIPSLQKIEEQYKGKNIEFVSISIDAKKDHDKWKKMVDDQKLGGTQLIADNDWNSQFVKDFAIDGIPRFIIIGPDGKIVNPDAPRPSESMLVTVFNNLKL